MKRPSGNATAARPGNAGALTPVRESRPLRITLPADQLSVYSYNSPGQPKRCLPETPHAEIPRREQLKDLVFLATAIALVAIVHALFPAGGKAPESLVEMIRHSSVLAGL